MNEPLAMLAELDAELDGQKVQRRTLDPNRERARSLVDIGRTLLPRTTELAAGSSAALATGLEQTARAIFEHFPENLLWDLDHLSASILREAARMPEQAPERLRASFAEIVELNALFGCATPIRFRYVHDFVYGFDWAKWVQRDPDARSSIGPFDLQFLRALRARAFELLALIEKDDQRYPQLRDVHARNPFAFSREPTAELELYMDLARHALVPVQAWSFDAAPIWNLPFAEEREARARSLGLIA
jgi:hypothetical protein